MLKTKNFLMISLLVILCSCATIFSGTSQKIHIQAVDEQTKELIDDVKCTLTDSRNIKYNIPTNPGVVDVTKGGENLTPICVKPGYIQKNFGAGNSFDKITIINVLFWPGFIVDVLTGATHKYPSHIVVFMEKKYKS